MANAREAFDKEPAVSIWRAVQEFSMFFKKNLGKQIWGHGGNFDEPILTNVYNMLEMTAPWKFWDCRCTRTAYEDGWLDSRSIPREGTRHNALDDAGIRRPAFQAAYRKKET